MSSMTASLSSHSLSNSSPLQTASDPSADLIRVAEIGVSDRVLIVGRNVIEQVLGLVRAGCRSVLSLRAGSSCPRGEAADILWLSGLDDAHDRLAAALEGGEGPRVVVVESDGANAEAGLRPLFRQLRAKGFVRFTTHRDGSRIALVAARPSWLQRVH